VICPALICTKESNNLFTNGENQCFSIATDSQVENIYVRDCYDEEARKNKDADVMFCPFDLSGGEYAWIDEEIQ